ncbi:MAG: LysM peptidoglycan-binding domain-containing protein [Chlorobi bacterium]|nr:LysM peptidoglycan-binding domain-containing protein [Chlorobiota bacterium]
MKKILIIIFSLLLIPALNVSCGSHKKTVTRKHTKRTQTRRQYGSHDERTLAYIRRYKDIAKKEMKEYKIPASITLAQGILESKAGDSRLAREANNHFGIKCGNDWEGRRVLHDDDHRNECFRVYNNPEESFRDHSKFLAQKRRYAFLFRFPLTDYEAWAKGLRQAGYATDRSYPQKLIYLIEKYNLDKYDKEVLEEMNIRTPEEDTPAKDKKKDKGEKIIYEVKAGETLFSISRKFGIPVREIKELNNLVDFDIYEGQILVLKVPEEKAEEESAEPVQQDTAKTAASEQKEEPVKSTESPDRTAAQTADTLHRVPDKKAVEAISQIAGEENTDRNTGRVHVVQQGETLYSIARQYGLTPQDIIRANALTGETLSPGQKLVIPEKSQTAGQTNTQTPAQTLTGTLHTVQPGETLYSIARKYGVSVQDIIRANRLADQHISPGQELLIPEKTQTQTQPAQTAEPGLPEYHIVQPGETLYRIHVKYGIPVETLRRLNGLKDNTIHVGQKLKLR